MNDDYDKLRDVVHNLRLCASVLEEIITNTGKPKAAALLEKKTSRRREFDDLMEEARKAFPYGVPSGNKVRIQLNVNYHKSQKIIRRLAKERVSVPSTVEAAQEPALFEAAPSPAPFVPFDDRPEVKATLATLSETLAGAVGSIAQALVDDEREHKERLDDKYEQIARVRKHMNI